MRCLVTGGTGFIGSNIALELHRQGHDVIITGTNYEQKLPEFKDKTLQPSFLGLDFDRIGKVDVVFHQAGITDNQFTDKSEVLRANVLSTKKLFDYVIKQGCKKIVYASSTAIYGMKTQPPYKESQPPQPHNVYAKSKVLIEKYADFLSKAHPDVTFVGLRYCNVFGPRENHKGTLSTMIYQFAQQMLKGNPRMFKFGEHKRDYIYVNDVVRANLMAAKATKSCVVNCGGGSSTSFKEIMNILNKVLGLNREADFIENPYKENYQDYTETDMTLAKEKIGFQPEFTVESGIKDYFESGFLVDKKELEQVKLKLLTS